MEGGGESGEHSQTLVFSFQFPSSNFQFPTSLTGGGAA